MASPAIEVVSWDVDGTLYDMGRVVRRVAWRGLRGLLWPGPIRTFRELSRLRRFRALMKAVRDRGGALDGDLPADRDALVELERIWYGPAIAGAGPRATALATIDRFRDLGLRQVVASDYRSDYKLPLLGLDGAFERIYAGEQVGYLKPSPELFRHIAADLGVAPDRILHIGDRPDTDGAAATAAGCRWGNVHTLQPAGLTKLLQSSDHD